MMTCSAVLFGPQGTDIKADGLAAIRQALLTSLSFRELQETVQQLNDFAKLLEASDPELKPIQITESASLLVQWIQGNDTDILKATSSPGSLSSSIATPLTVLNQVLLLSQQWRGHSQAYDQDGPSITPETRFEGLCIGHLAAAAARLSQDGEEEDWSRLASAAVRLAFCVGVYIDLDRHNAGVEEATCLVVACHDEPDEFGRLDDILSRYPTVSTGPSTLRALQVPNIAS